MRIISFSEVRFVRAILEERKMQTIRPLSLRCPYCGLCLLFNKTANMQGYEYPFTCPNCVHISDPPKYKPIHKFSDMVKLVYKQRVLKKYDYFCLKCGKDPNRAWSRDLPMAGLLSGNCLHCRKRTKILPKHFATAKITDVLEIELENAGMTEIRGMKIPLHQIRGLGGFKNIAYFNGFARLDGFKDFEEMFQWFDKKYDLSSPKRFAVYRFKLV